MLKKSKYFEKKLLNTEEGYMGAKNAFLNIQTCDSM